jgi:hypothetical protein
MAKPTIAWMPVRYIHPILQGQMTLWDWLRQAPAFGVQAVEIYHAFHQRRDSCPRSRQN